MPVDVVIADKFAADANTKIVPVDQIDPEWMSLDSGPKTTELYQAALKDAKTVVWNGPYVFEFDAFAKGTESL